MSPQFGSSGFAGKGSEPRKSLGESMVEAILPKIQQVRNLQANLDHFANCFGAPALVSTTSHGGASVKDDPTTIVSAFDRLEAELNILETIADRLR